MGRYVASFFILLSHPKLLWAFLLSVYRNIMKLPMMQPYEVACIKSFLLALSPKSGVLEVFEYGSGNSTVYFPAFLRKQGIKFHWYSVEHDPFWYKRIAPMVKNMEDVSYTLKELGKDYVTYPTSLGIRFGLIMVDGRMRNDCMEEACKILAGVVVLHDAQRDKYHPSLTNFKHSMILNSKGRALYVGSLKPLIDTG